MVAMTTWFTSDGLLKQSCGSDTISAPVARKMARNTSALDSALVPGASNRGNFGSRKIDIVRLAEK